MNKERIIKALECCQTVTPIDCRNCGYKDQTTPEYKSCFNLLMADALELIKELQDKYERVLNNLKVVLEEREEEQNDDDRK